MKNSLTVGQTVYLNPFGHGGRHGHGGRQVQKGTISKIGKKYFEIEGFYRDRFFIDTMRHDGEKTGYGCSWKVHISKQEILDEAEEGQLREELRKAFAWDGKKFTLEQLRKIKAIITG
jgi:hypothetical protein